MKKNQRNIRLSLWFILDVNVLSRGQTYEKDDKDAIVGPSSYKEHGYRMLLIWTSGLGPEAQFINELHEALSIIGKKSVAGV